ncbi:hypothetical protein POD19_08605 [Micrococcus sp. GPGPB33]|uniref:hypothetical protein n=1 Tax=Micrococcus sp. GPGPB33 TaxID=3023084 RepID=UPI0030C63EE6
MAGPSGTGKSTVLRLLAGLLRQDAAEATGRVAGVDTERTLWIGQHPVLTERTVAGELDLAAGGALPGPVRSAVLAAVALEGLQERDPADLSPGSAGGSRSPASWPACTPRTGPARGSYSWTSPPPTWTAPSPPSSSRPSRPCPPVRCPG